MCDDARVLVVFSVRNVVRTAAYKPVVTWLTPSKDLKTGYSYNDENKLLEVPWAFKEEPGIMM